MLQFDDSLKKINKNYDIFSDIELIFLYFSSKRH